MKKSMILLLVAIASSLFGGVAVADSALKFLCPTLVEVAQDEFRKTTPLEDVRCQEKNWREAGAQLPVGVLTVPREVVLPNLHQTPPEGSIAEGAVAVTQWVVVGNPNVSPVFAGIVGSSERMAAENAASCAVIVPAYEAGVVAQGMAHNSACAMTTEKVRGKYTCTATGSGRCITGDGQHVIIQN